MSQSKVNILKNILKTFYYASIICLVSFCFAFFSSISQDKRIFSVIEKHKSIPINGEIYSKYSNLGSIVLSFNRPATNKGNFTFKLQEKGSKKVHYRVVYSLSDVYYLPAFPFGFPTIENSKNKIYLYSLTPHNLSLKKGGITYVLIYSFDKSSLLKGNTFFQYVEGKRNQYINELIDSKNIIFFILPVLIYILFSIIKSVLKSNFENSEIYLHFISLIHPFFLTLFIYIFFDIVFTATPQTDTAIIIVSALWSILIFTYRYSYKKSLVFALLFFFISPIFSYANMGISAEKSAMWAYIFMVIGVIHAFIEIKRQNVQTKFDIEEKLHVFLKNIVLIEDMIWSLCRKISIKKFESKIEKKDLKDYLHFIFTKVKEYIFYLLYVIFITLIILTVVIVYSKVMNIRDRNLKNPVVQQVEPTLVYPSTKVLLFGNSFGSKIDDRYRLMKDGTEVRPDYWEDHKIIFTVPLGWKTGFMNIWVERPVKWNGETIIEKTKPIQIKLLPVTQWLAPDDDLYFEQMKKWKKETKDINGYN